MKRLLSLVLCVILGIGCVVPASAAAPADLATEVELDPPILRMSYTHQTVTQISISGGKAICVGNITGYKGTTTKVEITLTLQRKLASSSTWSNYYNHPKQTFNTHCGTVSFSKDIVKGYQYRTKAVYTAYAGTKYETFTEYSGAQAY